MNQIDKANVTNATAVNPKVLFAFSTRQHVRLIHTKSLVVINIKSGH